MNCENESYFYNSIISSTRKFYFEVQHHSLNFKIKKSCLHFKTLNKKFLFCTKKLCIKIRFCNYKTWEFGIYFINLHSILFFRYLEMLLFRSLEMQICLIVSLTAVHFIGYKCFIYDTHFMFANSSHVRRVRHAFLYVLPSFQTSNYVLELNV